MSDLVLDVRDLKVEFATDNEPIVAVDGISFQLQRGQKLGVVGESGSGKSVTSLAVMGLVPYPGRISSGEIWFSPAADSQAVNLCQVSNEEKRHYRGGEVALIFQEPMSALNPVYNIGFQLIEAIRLHQRVSFKEAKRQAIASLQEVKLLPSDDQLRANYLVAHGASETPEREINRSINQQKSAILERYPHELSGGQLQRVCIAMAISSNPTLLIADEPTTALDVTVQATILDLLRQLCNSRGMSLIFITHDLGVIAEIADHVAVMYKGKIVEQGRITRIFRHPQHPYTKGLIACRPRLDEKEEYLPTVADFMEVLVDEQGNEKIVEKEQLPRVNKSQESEVKPKVPSIPACPPFIGVVNGQVTPRVDIDAIEDSSPAQTQLIPTANKTKASKLDQLTSQSPILSVEDLQIGYPLKGVFGRTKRYFMAVSGISFDVYPGETLGLVGESGCGKSTLARSLLGLTPILQGMIWFDGLEITRLKNRGLCQLRREMQIVFQNPYNSLNPRISIGQAIMEPLKIHNLGKGRRERRDRVAYLLERVGIDPGCMKRYPHEFSGGQRQRICIARALALNPKFIICDESVSALDVSVQAQVLNLLKELQAEFGLTYIFISHDLSVVKFMSDRIMVMNRGKVEEIGSAQAIYRQPQKEYTRQLIASIPNCESIFG